MLQQLWYMQVNTHISIYTQLVFLWELNASGYLKVHSLLDSLHNCQTVLQHWRARDVEKHSTPATLLDVSGWLSIR